MPPAPPGVLERAAVLLARKQGSGLEAGVRGRVQDRVARDSSPWSIGRESGTRPRGGTRCGLYPRLRGLRVPRLVEGCLPCIFTSPSLRAPISVRESSLWDASLPLP